MSTKLLPFTLESFGMTHPGLIREKNEDRWIGKQEQNFFIVADGMGGHTCGDLAAEIALSHYCSLSGMGDPFAQSSIDEAKILMQQQLEATNLAVYQEGRSQEHLKKMGTTICVAHFHPEGLVYGHVGDSRIYLKRDQHLFQLTEDHSLVSELVELGEMSEWQANRSSKRHIITRAIGASPILVPSIESCELVSGDVILMCSDGLSDYLSIKEMEEVLSESSNLKLCVHRLIDEANFCGGSDNITAVMIRYQKND